MMVIMLAAHAAAQAVYEDTFLSDQGAWDGGAIQDGMLLLVGDGATLPLPDAATLSARLLLRQRDAAALRLILGDVTWTADYQADGGLVLGAAVLHFPHGHRAFVTEAQPVLRPDAGLPWESGSILHCDVHHDAASGMWFLFYTGVMSPGYGYRQIGVATSTDGESWTRHADNPIITIDYSRETIDGIHAHMPSVVVDDAGVWHMIYACYQNDVGNRLCHATSKDGLSWTRPDYGAGRMALDLGEAGAFDDASLREPDVSIAADGSLQLLYVGTRADEHYGPAGLARSTDGGWTWERIAQLTEGESELQGGTVLQSAYGLEQWYQCDDAFCFADSPGVDAHGAVDWTDWTLDPEPVLTKGWADWSSGYIQAPSAWLVDGRVVHLWFNAYDYGTGQEVLGHARSVPLPDQWVVVALAWDGTELSVTFDGGPPLTAALDSVDSLRIESDGTAQLDEIRLEWTAPDTAPRDTADTADTAPPDTAPSDTADTAGEPGAVGCGCGASGRGHAVMLLGLWGLWGRTRRR